MTSTLSEGFQWGKFMVEIRDSVSIVMIHCNETGSLFWMAVSTLKSVM